MNIHKPMPAIDEARDAKLPSRSTAIWHSPIVRPGSKPPSAVCSLPARHRMRPSATLSTFVCSGSVAGGVAANTAFLDFPNEAKCRAAAGAMEASERVSITFLAPCVER
jgi:hypothetical protein